MSEVKRIALAALLLLSSTGCARQEQPAARAIAGGDAERGVVAIRRYGCGACHTIPGIPNATGRMGPSLAGLATRTQLASGGANQPENLVVWITDPQTIAPGTSMPDVGVTEDEARDIVAYLYTLR